MLRVQKIAKAVKPCKNAALTLTKRQSITIHLSQLNYCTLTFIGGFEAQM
jgi:hypothetical protein